MTLFLFLQIMETQISNPHPLHMCPQKKKTNSTKHPWKVTTPISTVSTANEPPLATTQRSISATESSSKPQSPRSVSQITADSWRIERGNGVDDGVELSESQQVGGGIISILLRGI
jgi:hypothetical protein